MSRIFINYRRQDSEGYVGRLYDRLIQQFDRESIFMDVDDIKPGADFVQTLEDAVARCDVFIAVIGPVWTTVADGGGQRRLDQWNDFVRIEIASAIKQGKMVIPVLVGQAKMPNLDELPEDMKSLARRNAIELSHQRFSYDIERLIRAILDGMPERGSTKPHDAAKIRAKESALRQIRLEVLSATTSPLYQFRTENRLMPVAGDGNPDANILFIGQAPGKTEAVEGRAFVGQSGEVLDEMLKGINLKRDDIYITNVVLDRAPDNRDPTVEEIKFYTPFVDRIIDTIQPGVIVPLGRFAMEYILKKYDLPEKRSKIGELHGKLLRSTAPYGEIYVLPLYHPAVVLYSASQKDTLREDFKKLKLFI
ncbi:MAG TPA: uracil-DNA glycosylase family protein [Phototrophicaceae bacterium]|jgi:DNA polymerase|nr:uracil-DNA glycosylase family protein [Phototrophicaceae bacterium]